MRRLIWGFACPTYHMLEISCHGSIIFFRGIERKVGRSLTWLILGMPVCPWFGLARRRRSSRSKLFANFESRWERERETSACIRISCNLESVLKMKLGDISAFAWQSRIFDSIDALHAFYRIPICLNWQNILSRILCRSDLDPNSDNVFFLF